MLCLLMVRMLPCMLLLLLQEGQLSTVAAGSSRELDDLHAGDQLPVAQHGKDNQLALSAAATAFPHEFRYCYWSNEVYRPNNTHQQQQYAALPAGARQPAALAQVRCACCSCLASSKRAQLVGQLCRTLCRLLCLSMLCIDACNSWRQ
jgi:hypothetical protein